EVSVPMVFAQSGAIGSATVTFVSVTLPVLVTVIVQVAVPLKGTDCVFGFLVIEIAGVLGVTGVTVTGAESFAVTVPPYGVVPTTVATWVKVAVAFARVPVRGVPALAVSVPRLRSQSGVSGSVTVTFVSVTLPVLVTTMVKLAVPPLGIVCDFGFLVIEIAG